jgi:hypothetical protein
MSPTLSAIHPKGDDLLVQCTNLDLHLVLRTVLLLHQSSQLHLLASRAEQHLSRSEVKEMLDLLCKMGLRVEDAIRLVKEDMHCVRCHETYVERENNDTACLIDHDLFKHEGERGFRITCESCHSEYGTAGIIDGPKGGICFMGEHTTRPDKASYDNENTLTCKEIGCPPLHCVRCHESYHALDNLELGDPCCVKHRVVTGEGKDCGDGTRRYACKSCGEVGVQVGEGNGIFWTNHGICFKGGHTTDSEEVNYDGENTVTCAVKGCLFTQSER